MNVKKLIPLLFAILISLTSAAQYKGQLRGMAVEQLLQQPLSGATVTLSPLKRTVVTDAEGLFRFTDIPVGSYSITISYAGFKEVVLENIQINSGKETVLTIPMDAVIKAETEVVLQVNSKKNKPLNEMNAVSARAFTVEETQKYAAAVNDPLRMAVAFPGVMAGDDGNNSIIIRGNSPVGLLWRMEGLDIPNPNHFALPGNSGGGISILSAQVLANSDFVTAAFAAEYGNAVSGVFDLHLRKGNNEKREYSLQAGVLGLNASLTGTPLLVCLLKWAYSMITALLISRISPIISTCPLAGPATSRCLVSTAAAISSMKPIKIPVNGKHVPTVTPLISFPMHL